MVKQQRKERLHNFFREHNGELKLFCGCDQAGTLMLLTDAAGRPVKETMRDSFGIWRGDTFPDLFMPIGFAGGLTDPDTGLVRFGYRDYDPSVGRFTAPDPLGDTGGDHDLYDYCIDDPVSFNDPLGLDFGLTAALLLGLAASGALAGAGVYASAKAVDSIESARTGKKSSAARDAVTNVAPKAASIHAAAFSPLALASMPRLGASLGRHAGALVESSGHAGKIKAVGDFAQGLLNPNPGLAPSVAEGGGAFLTWVNARLQEFKNKKAYKK